MREDAIKQRSNFGCCGRLAREKKSSKLAAFNLVLISGNNAWPESHWIEASEDACGVPRKKHEPLVTRHSSILCTVVMAVQRRLGQCSASPSASRDPEWRPVQLNGLPRQDAEPGALPPRGSETT